MYNVQNIPNWASSGYSQQTALMENGALKNESVIKGTNFQLIIICKVRASGRKRGGESSQMRTRKTKVFDQKLLLDFREAA